MGWEAVALGLTATGSSLLLMALFAPPQLFRRIASLFKGSLPEHGEEEAGPGVHRMTGWWGVLLCLSGLMTYILYAISNDPLFWGWCLPMLLAATLWWSATEKVLPQCEKLGSALALSTTEPSDEQLEREAMALLNGFERMFKLHAIAIGLLATGQLLVAISLLG